ncbi:MAG: hypothetical protein H8E72_02145 [Candidatus Marinimicrobia bacterium]|nr:hypothetical protein [Candidatus Neomarinimicrobiota bacterium]
MSNCIAHPENRDFPRYDFTYPEQIESEHFIVHFTTSNVDSQFVNNQWLNLQCNFGYAQSVIDLAEYALAIFMAADWEMMPPDCDESITDEASPNHCNNFGGDALYDIYLANDAVGLVVPENPYPVEPYTGGYTSFMQVTPLGNEHTFVPVWSEHVIAHELHHAIQVRYGTSVSGEPGNYAFNGWLYEQTSTYMEAVIFPGNYHFLVMMGNCNITSPLTFPEISIDSSVDIYQYRSALWQKFLVEAYGDSSVNRLIWEGFGLETSTGNPVDMFPIYESAVQAVTNGEISLSDAYEEYAVWRYFTGSRSRPGEYFMQAASYCKADLIEVDGAPSTLPTEKGGARLVKLFPYENSLLLSANVYESLLLQHISFGEDDEVLMSPIEVNGGEFYFQVNNPNEGNHALLLTTKYTGEPSLEIEFTLSATVPFMEGDITGDSMVNVQDVIVQINIILHQIDPTEYQWLAADLDGNNVIDVLDVILLVNLILA